MPNQSLEVRIETTADTPGGKLAAAALNQTSDAARRLQRVFDSTAGDASIAESLQGMARGAEDAQKACEQWSQRLHEEFTRPSKDPESKPPAAGNTASDAAQEWAIGPEIAARDARARRMDVWRLPGADRRAGAVERDLAAAHFAASEAKTGATGESPLATAARPPARSPVAAATQAVPPGALGTRNRAAVGADSSQTVQAATGSGQAWAAQDRDLSSAQDRVDPAIKALLVEIGKMQDRHVNALKQAVDVISGASRTVDGMVGLMRTVIARQAQLQGEQAAMAQQMAAWARSTQIP